MDPELPSRIWKPLQWLARYWLVLLIPPIVFLLAAGVTRQLRRSFQGAKYTQWNELYSAAVQAGFRGDRKLALQRMLQAAAAAPADAEVHSRLALGFEKLGQETRALDQLEKALSLRRSSDDQPDAYLALAGAHINRGDFEQAERVLREEVLPRWPDSAEARYYQGLIELEGRAGRSGAEAALSHFERFLQGKPDDPRGLYQKGVCQLRLGQARQAAATLQKVVAQRPWFASAYHDLSTALRRIGQTNEASQALERFQELESMQRQVRHLETQLSLDKLEREELAELADLYLNLHRFEEAELAWTRFTEAEPTDARGYRGLAKALRALRKDPIRAEKLAAALERPAQPGR